MEARQTKAGTWRCRAYNKFTGKQVSFTAKTQREAERKANLYYLTEVNNVTTDLTIGEAMDLYIESHESIWSPTTLREYKRNKERYFDDWLDKPLKKVDNVMAQKMVNQISKNRSYSTVENAWCLMSGVLRTYKPAERISVSMPKKYREQIQIPAEDDIRALIEVAKNTNLLVPIYLGAFCAMRRGEVCALDISHINFKTREIFIEYSMAFDGTEWVRKKPKTVESVRRIIAPQIVIDAIKKHGLKPVSPNRITNGMPKLCKRANIQSYRYHSMRHYCASKMLSMNIPIPDVMRYGGWENDSTLKQIYMHSLNESMQKSVDKWNEQTGDFLSKKV